MMLILMTMCSFSFNINSEKTFLQMKEEVGKYPHLMITPPLHLKDVGIEAPRLIHLSHGKLCAL